MGWTTPKTDWKSTDRFNYSDYNRIKNNISYIQSKANERILIHSVSITDMGDDITSYSAFFYADEFNAFEDNVKKINESGIYKTSIKTHTFYPNAKFINYEELNELESAILTVKMSVDDSDKKQKLSIRLGNTNKSIKV